jgi:hypothetical protein
MLNLRETIDAAMNPHRKPTTYAEWERWFRTYPRACGNCNRWKSNCPKSYVDVGRMLRVFPQPESDPCDKWTGTQEYREREQEFVLAKLAHNFQS